MKVLRAWGAGVSLDGEVIPPLEIDDRLVSGLDQPPFPTARFTNAGDAPAARAERQAIVLAAVAARMTEHGETYDAAFAAVRQTHSGIFAAKSVATPLPKPGHSAFKP